MPKTAIIVYINLKEPDEECKNIRDWEEYENVWIQKQNRDAYDAADRHVLHSSFSRCFSWSLFWPDEQNAINTSLRNASTLGPKAASLTFAKVIPSLCLPNIW